MNKNYLHIPVLLAEVLTSLEVSEGEKYIDCTLGAGGHSEAILQKGGKLLGIEADTKMIDTAKERLKNYCPTLLQGNFSDIAEIARKNDFLDVSGVLFDLGVSTYHYESLGRGFSINKLDEPLDMRLEPERRSITAQELIMMLPEERLVEMFSFVLPAHKTRVVAKQIIKHRRERAIKTVNDLRAIIHKDLPEVFLALRMAVNDEIHAIESGVSGALKVLKKGGVIVVISFHSGEDRLVVHLMKQFEMGGQGKLLTGKPVTPTLDEVNLNPKSRSALMRVFKKIEYE